MNAISQVTTFELNLLLAGLKVEHAIYVVIGDENIVTRSLRAQILLVEAELADRATMFTK